MTTLAQEVHRTREGVLDVCGKVLAARAWVAAEVASVKRGLSCPLFDTASSPKLRWTQCRVHTKLVVSLEKQFLTGREGGGKNKKEKKKAVRNSRGNTKVRGGGRGTPGARDKFLCQNLQAMKHPHCNRFILKDCSPWRAPTRAG